MLVIDANNYLHRVTENRFGGGIHPVREAYNRFLIPQNDTVIVVWDGPSSNKARKDFFPEYKANRPPKEESKLQFFELAKVAIGFTGVIQIEVPGYEADDVIATIINKYYQTHKLIIESNDGDYWQHKDKCELPLISKKWENFTADQCLLYKSIVGDRKDNIPGLKGFGTTSWDKLSQEGRQNLIASVKLNDYERFLDTSVEFPKRVKGNLETFEQLCLYWKCNHWIKVPESLIDENTTVGRNNPEAAEHFLRKYMI